MRSLQYSPMAGAVGVSLAALALLGLEGCSTRPQAPTAMRGANFMTLQSAPWDSPAARDSLAQLQDIGATWVALVPFVRQARSTACTLTAPDTAELNALRTLIQTAHQLGLGVVLKPQILIDDSWAGAVAMPDEAAWACWFQTYGRALSAYARIAEEEGVDLLVAGTELKRTEARPEWPPLLRRIARLYNGPISYVFHQPEDAPGFTGLAELDSVGYSLYPPIGNDIDQLASRIEGHVRELRQKSRRIGKPVWIAELGMPSRHGAGDAPWLWGPAVPQPALPDPDFQAQALEAWLSALAGDWHQGVMLWGWVSEPHAGGMHDTSYTPQNKPAMQRLACLWRGRCAQ